MRSNLHIMYVKVHAYSHKELKEFQAAWDFEIHEQSTGHELARFFYKSLPKALRPLLNPVALRINGKLKDLSYALQAGDEVEILSFEDKQGQQIFWHSSAHILAQAVLRLFPQAKPTIGPPTENGFFYDFAELSIEEADLQRIEKVAHSIAQENLLPDRIEFQDEADAREVFKENPFKVAILEGREETLSAYRQGEFIDLCTGPHLPYLGMVRAFKILKTSGAYWRGDSQNTQLTRIYAISFPDKKLLAAYLKRQEEAKRRDHRILGKSLDLYSFHSEESPGMPFFHPSGLVLWDSLIDFEAQLQKEQGYISIKTPILLARELWERSGHWENYHEHMYVTQKEDRSLAIKPMNCPGCMLYYKDKQYSYKQLPIRISEIGLVHRHELSGTLSGLFRVSSFHQDDAHIFMRLDQVKTEILAILRLAEQIYSTFGLEYHLELSTRPKKSIGSEMEWEHAIACLKEALNESQKPFVINEGDGAFYGPKIDFHIKDAIGRTWQCGTIQLDMALPKRFDIYYNTADAKKEHPVMLHRAIYGSLERFLAILIEHYAGRFPLWLSPIQITLLGVADRHLDSLLVLKKRLGLAGLRTELDSSTESIGKKVRNAQVKQSNYILVVGDKEEQSQRYTLRTRSGQIIPDLELEYMIQTLQQEIQEKKAESLFAISISK